jgi:hypothetical protein
MTMPRFTAEASLYKPTERYYMKQMAQQIDGVIYPSACFLICYPGYGCYWQCYPGRPVLE